MAFKIVNDRNEDNHMHTSTFSDGLNSVDKMVDYAGRFGLKKITITDHSQETIEMYKRVEGLNLGNYRGLTTRWKNVINKVEVGFGVEADLLNEQGDICDHIQNKKSDYLILSIHPDTYYGPIKKVNDAYEKAILQNKDRIKCIGHPDLIRDGLEYLNVNVLVELANKYNIPLELNGAYLMKNKLDLKIIKQILEKAKYIQVNSDAHTLYELKEARNCAYDFLRKEGYLKE